MAEEFIIKSQNIEDKINQLLPSQGGFQAGVDFSASTMVIPIVDLTETAEGSSLRQDLQTSFSFTNASNFNITNATDTVLVATTGYYRVFGFVVMYGSVNNSTDINIFDGTSDKEIFKISGSSGDQPFVYPFDFNVFLTAGDSLRGTSSSTGSIMNGSTRQIADLAGNLINP